jgi:undecaprenyl diphosphate synthase
MLTSVAFIPDGNRRFAAKHKLPLIKAYEMGFNKTREALKWTEKYKSIDTITVYTLSTENLARGDKELSIFLRMLERKMKELLRNKSEIHEYEVRVKVAGRLDLLSRSLQEAIKELEQGTEHYTRYRANLAIGYGGRGEIVDAVNRAIGKGEPINEENIQKNLYLKEEPQLIIRTGNAPRLSGFLTWQSIYSELYFSQRLWPEFEEREFKKAVDMYNSVEHNFGR